MIVNEARRCSAQAIVMPLPRADRRLAVRQDGRDRARRAPCRVIIHSDGARATPRRRAAARRGHRAAAEAGD
jgi:hypothetical protein